MMAKIDYKILVDKYLSGVDPELEAQFFNAILRQVRFVIQSNPQRYKAEYFTAYSDWCPGAFINLTTDFIADKLWPNNWRGLRQIYEKSPTSEGVVNQLCASIRHYLTDLFRNYLRKHPPEEVKEVSDEVIGRIGKEEIPLEEIINAVDVGRKFIESLTEEEQQILVARFGGGTYEQIGEKFGRKKSWVEKRIKDIAEKKLRKLCQDSPEIADIALAVASEILMKKKMEKSLK